MAWEKTWRYRGVPEIGDFVQCLCRHIYHGSSSVQTGVVTEVSNEGHIRFVGESRDDPCDWEVISWRKWIGPEFEHTVECKKKVDA